MKTTNNHTNTSTPYGTALTAFRSTLATIPLAILWALPTGTAQAQAWAPSALPDLTLWLDASTATSDAGTVSISNAGSGGGTISGPASLVANGIGSLQTVEFNGTSQYVTGDYINTGTTLTVFFVGKSASASQIPYARMMSVWQDGQANDWNNVGSAVLFNQNETSANTIVSARNSAGTPATSGTLTNPFMACDIYNGSTCGLYLNGATPVTYNSSGNFNTAKVVLGAGWTLSALNTWWKGYFGEAIVCNANLDESDRQKTEGYLAWKWGMQANLPPDHPYKSAPPATSLMVTVTAPANGGLFLPGSAVAAAATAAGGTAPYTVTYSMSYNGGAYGEAGTATTPPYTVDLGTLADGTYDINATVTDSATPTAGTATSATKTFTVAPDTTAPTPDPMTFAVNPAALDETSIMMAATTATDALSPPVQYYFENTTTTNSSGWISSPEWIETGLTTGVTYGYRVKARDSAATPVETAFSAVSSAYPVGATITWDANGADTAQTDGPGTWLGANQWWDGYGNPSWNNSVPNNAVIGSGGTGGTITLGAVVAGSVAFDNFTDTYTLAGGSLSTSGGITVGTTAGNVTISTPVSGSGGITHSGSGTLTLSGNKSFTGAITVSNGTLKGTGAGAFGSGTRIIDVNGGGILDFGASNMFGGHSSTTGNLVIDGGTVTNSNNSFSSLNNITLNGGTLTSTGGISGGDNWGAWHINGTVTSTGTSLIAGAATDGRHIRLNANSNNTDFDVQSGTLTVSAPIWNGRNSVNFSNENPSTLTKLGGGVMILSGANTYTGATTVSGGTLALGASDVLPNSTAVSLGTATLAVGASFTDDAGILDVTGSSAIDLGDADSKIAFADNGALLTWAGTLNITGTFVPGASVRFGTDASGLTTDQLNLITVNGSGTYTLDPAGYLIASSASGFDSWKTVNGAGLQTLDDDHDNDGVSNGIEYFLGGPTGTTTGFTPLPALIPAGLTFSITWNKGPGYIGTYGTHFQVETSATLDNPWTLETVGVTVTDTPTSVTFTFPAGTKNFARLKVTGP